MSVVLKQDSGRYFSKGHPVPAPLVPERSSAKKGGVLQGHGLLRRTGRHDGQHRDVPGGLRAEERERLRDLGHGSCCTVGVRATTPLFTQAISGFAS